MASRLHALFLIFSAQSGSGALIYISPANGSTAYRAIEAAAAGDEVVIAPGTYSFRVYLQNQGTLARPVYIHGQNPSNPPVWDPMGVAVGSLPGSYTGGDRARGFWQLCGASYITIAGIVIQNATSGSAAVRYYGGSNGLVFRRCVFRTNLAGGLTGGSQNSNATVTNSEFYQNGVLAASPPTHNVYIFGGTFVMRTSYLHDPVQGQNLHCRAISAVIEYNWMSRAKSYCCDLMTNDDYSYAPGPPLQQTMVIRGNVFVQGGTQSNGGKIWAVYNDEASGYPVSFNVTALYNTLIGANTGAAFIQLSNADGSAMTASLYNNILYGTTTAVSVSDTATASFSGRHNWLETGAVVAPTLTGSVVGTAPGFSDAATDNFTLAPGSSCIGAADQSVPGGLPASQYFENEVVTCSSIPRTSDADIGAFAAAVPGPASGTQSATSSPSARAGTVTPSQSSPPSASSTPTTQSQSPPPSLQPSSTTATPAESPTATSNAGSVALSPSVVPASGSVVPLTSAASASSSLPPPAGASSSSSSSSSVHAPSQQPTRLESSSNPPQGSHSTSPPPVSPASQSLHTSVSPVPSQSAGNASKSVLQQALSPAPSAEPVWPAIPPSDRRLYSVVHFRVAFNLSVALGAQRRSLKDDHPGQERTLLQLENASAAADVVVAAATVGCAAALNVSVDDVAVSNISISGTVSGSTSVAVSWTASVLVLAASNVTLVEAAAVGLGAALGPAIAAALLPFLVVDTTTSVLSLTLRTSSVSDVSVSALPPLSLPASAATSPSSSSAPVFPVVAVAVGAAVGGACAIVIIALTIFALRRRQCTMKHEQHPPGKQQLGATRAPQLSDNPLHPRRHRPASGRGVDAISVLVPAATPASEHALSLTAHSRRSERHISRLTPVAASAAGSKNKTIARTERVDKWGVPL